MNRLSWWTALALLGALSIVDRIAGRVHAWANRLIERSHGDTIQALKEHYEAERQRGGWRYDDELRRWERTA